MDNNDVLNVMQINDPIEKARNAAILLTLKGIPSFPCSDDKKPTCRHGFKDATNIPRELNILWRECPGPLVGVPTGQISGFDVLDIDPRHEGDKWFKQNLANIPPTKTHLTRGGGLHLLFKHRKGIRNSAGKIARGVDVRGDGGYIIWWPASGIKPVNNLPPTDWPQWIIDELIPQILTALPVIVVHHNKPYIQAALRNALQRVLNAPEGSRNDTLNAEAWSLARFIPTGELRANQIAAALSKAALAAGLGRQEIINTIASALRSHGV